MNIKISNNRLFIMPDRNKLNLPTGPLTTTATK